MQNEQNATDFYSKRKRHVFIFCSWLMLAMFILMSVIDYKEGDTSELIVDLLVFAVLAGGLIAIRTWQRDTILYRISQLLLCLSYFYTVSLGAGEETVLFWTFFMPPLYFFFFGKWEGAIWALLFTGCLAVIMLVPSLFDGHIYTATTISRYFITFPVVIIICFGLESSRAVFEEMLDEKNRLLQQEKDRLEQALKEIKTLGGLIPICARCKKIRNDEGYWEQVEIYFKKRSDADFSHGVCPECVKILYPGHVSSRVKNQAKI